MKVRSRSNPHSRFYLVEVFLGLALGLGYLTSLRFFANAIGPAEVLALLAVAAILMSAKQGVPRFGSLRYERIKIFWGVSIGLIVPSMTFVSYLLEIRVIYAVSILAFMFGYLIFFLVTNPKRQNIDLEVVVWFFAVSYFLSVVATYLIAPQMLASLEDGARFEGGAKNPNQVALYAISLIFLGSVCCSRWLVVVIIVLATIVGYLTKSDAFDFSVILFVSIYLMLRLVPIQKMSFIVLMFSMVLVLALFTLLLMANESVVSSLGSAWREADTGSFGRLYLAKNAILASAYSPIFGLGAGAFSGYLKPFEGFEAHNTVLDLAMTFGWPFTISIYSIFVIHIYRSAKSTRRAVAAAGLAFVAFSMGHFVARHFVFWVVLAAMFNDLQQTKTKQIGHFANNPMGLLNKQRKAKAKGLWPAQAAPSRN